MVRVVEVLDREGGLLTDTESRNRTWHECGEIANVMQCKQCICAILVRWTDGRGDGQNAKARKGEAMMYCLF